MDAATIEDLFAPFGPVSVRRMFGGAGIYHRGLMLALESDGTFYLKVDEISRPRFEAAGSHPFTYNRKNGVSTSTSYWRLPEEALDEPDALRSWVAEAYGAAIRRDAAKKRPKSLG